MGMIPMVMPIVSGTVLECRVPGCTQPAKTKRTLCRAHAARRVLYTLMQLAGLIALAVAGFAIALWIGLAIVGVALLVIGLVLETS